MRGFWNVYSAAAGLLLAALIAIGVALFAAGAVDGERLEAALRGLREGPPAPAEAPKAPAPAAAEGTGKEEDLRRLEGRVTARLAQVDAERARLAEETARLRADREAFERRRLASTQGGSDADLAANVPILSRMDGASIVTVLQGWDDATFVRYLRALKPGKAAEVIDALQNDPSFEQEFRRPPPGAPRGTRPRAALLMEEFKKAPPG